MILLYTKSEVGERKEEVRKKIPFYPQFRGCRQTSNKPKQPARAFCSAVLELRFSGCISVKRFAQVWERDKG